MIHEEGLRDWLLDPTADCSTLVTIPWGKNDKGDFDEVCHREMGLKLIENSDSSETQ